MMLDLGVIHPQPSQKRTREYLEEFEEDAVEQPKNKRLCDSRDTTSELDWEAYFFSICSVFRIKLTTLVFRVAFLGNRL